MPDDEDWEIIPHKILADLRDDVQALKEKLSKPEEPQKELLASIAELQKSIAQLQGVFQGALQEMRTEGEGAHEGKAHQDILAKLTEVSGQNTQIAKAIVAIADMVEEMNRRLSAPRAPPRMMPSPPRSPPFPQPPPPIDEPFPFLEEAPLPLPRAPPSMPPPPRRGPDLPPPPPPEKKRLFGSLFRK